VYAHHFKIIAAILFVPFPDPGNHPLAVNSTKGPELDQDHFAPQLFQRERLVAVDPHVVGEIGGRAQVRWAGRNGPRRRGGGR
jgi:hypothetical protein